MCEYAGDMRTWPKLGVQWQLQTLWHATPHCWQRWTADEMHGCAAFIHPRQGAGTREGASN